MQKYYNSSNSAAAHPTQLTVVESGAYGEASQTHTHLCNGLQSRRLHSPEVWTVINEVTQANE